MTLQELAARDFKRAKINYLRAKERPSTPPAAFANLKSDERKMLDEIIAEGATE